MAFFISFLEGIVTFLSPCLLPMIPIYLTYFAGGGERSAKKTLLGAAGFVSGFTIVFTAMGALAGTLGGLLVKYQIWVNLLCGGVVILLGLGYLGFFRWNLFRGHSGIQPENMNFFSAAAFGMAFSLGWTPCVGTFLGSALMLASQRGHVLEGMGMLMCYSMGLGIPFLFSAMLIDRLKHAFGWIKSHYSVINAVCGWLLVAVGILMATGTMGRLLSLLQR